jgi:DNA mismatch repair protein MutS
MRQYAAAKQQNPDALLFFRMGDFYELFFDDAKVAARELEITLTARDREKTVPMCGVPYHAAEAYLARLLRKGYRVAICEQMEDPKLTKKIVRREVTRVLTPGTAIDSDLAAEKNNFLAAIYVVKTAAVETAALAMLDLSTGYFMATEMTGPQALARCLAEAEKLQPAELLYPAAGPLVENADAFAQNATALEGIRTKTPLDAWVFTGDYALPLLQKQLNAHSLDGFGLSGHTAAAIAAGAIIHYVRQTQQADLSHIDSLSFYAQSNDLELDLVTLRNLELVEPLFADSARDTTLFRTLDCCITPMGKRLLRSWILRPSISPEVINSRLDAVAFLRARLMEREDLRRLLGNVYDLERMLARVSLDTATPRDVSTMGASLTKLPLLTKVLQVFPRGRWSELAGAVDPLVDLCEAICRTLIEQPPVSIADGGVIAQGRHAELDELRTLSQSGRQSIAAIEERERQRTGIGSLKVKFNSVFGYYIEITRSNLKSVPADYERKQTLVNAERFTTPELKDYETRILTAHERAVEIEKTLFAELRQTIVSASSRIRRTAAALAEIDVLSAFAHLAVLRNYNRPTLVEHGAEDGGILEAVAARHPIVECRLEASGEGRFVPNDLHLSTKGPAVLVITGPNMGGKSTYLRQAAMLVIMAQIGSFVPADSMRFSIVDRVFTRIGASDNVARGRSTFMVEMMETATILNTATDRSLILLDEMGRGTATFDGLSLAWSTLEFLHARIGARTLFATHYHELTMLADSLPRLKNLRVAVKETPNGISFLHSIEPGAANRSYGIDVAKLAGLPASVIERAKVVLREHERSEKRTIAAETEAPMQMLMFTPLSQRILDRLEETDINQLTPMQALNLIEALKNEIRTGTLAASKGD